MSEYPWSKREVVDAVIAEFRPFNVDQIMDQILPNLMAGNGLDSSNMQELEALPYWTVFRAFTRVALGRPEGRASPVDERALWLRCGRVYLALRDGRDPNAAYETPLADEEPLTAEIQMQGLMTPAYRDLARLLDETDRKLRRLRARR